MIRYWTCCPLSTLAGVTVCSTRSFGCWIDVCDRAPIFSWTVERWSIVPTSLGVTRTVMTCSEPAARVLRGKQRLDASLAFCSNFGVAVTRVSSFGRL